jgi:hypothetical protein
MERVTWLLDLLNATDVPEAHRAAIRKERFTQSGEAFFLDHILHLINTRWRLQSPAHDFATGEDAIDLATVAIDLWIELLSQTPELEFRSYTAGVDHLLQTLRWPEGGAAMPEAFCTWQSGIIERIAQLLMRWSKNPEFLGYRGLQVLGELTAALPDQVRREEILLSALASVFKRDTKSPFKTRRCSHS